MSRATSLSPTYRNPDSATTLWVGWAVYGGIAFLGFCFGVWAGNQRPKTIEIVKASPAPAPTKEPEPSGEGTPTPTPKKGTPPQQKKFDPSLMPKKKDDTVVAMGDPKPMETMPEMKKNEPPPPPPMPKTVTSSLTYDKDILPILRANCLNCHGDPLKKGEFDIRSLASLKIGGDSGAGVIAGDAEKSPLWERIFDNSMPPRDSNKMLTPMEKMMIKEWIEGGAK